MEMMPFPLDRRLFGFGEVSLLVTDIAAATSQRLASGGSKDNSSPCIFISPYDYDTTTHHPQLRPTKRFRSSQRGTRHAARQSPGPLDFGSLDPFQTNHDNTSISSPTHFSSRSFPFSNDQKGFEVGRRGTLLRLLDSEPRRGNAVFSLHLILHSPPFTHTGVGLLAAYRRRLKQGKRKA